jgi:hypothetical protein
MFRITYGIREYFREYCDRLKYWFLSNNSVEYCDGTKPWYSNNKQHREDGPTIEFSDGSKHWYSNGKFHREDGPAIEYSDGTKEWWLNGKLHREDGPAVEHPDGIKEWNLNDEEYSEEEWRNKIELENSRIEEAKNLFESNLILRLKDTNFGYLKFQYQWVNLSKENYLDDVAFEYVLDSAPSYVQEKLLFHLDIFLPGD